MNNILKISKLSKVNYVLNSTQLNSLVNSIRTVQTIEEYFENNINGVYKIKSSIFLNSLLEKEAIDSSRIEGTQTNHDELFIDIEGIDNVYSWETRNLINLYKDTFRRLADNKLRLNIERLIIMHESLYKDKIGKKWNQTFNATAVINKNKPGHIITNDQTPNWIGLLGTAKEKANLIPVKPSQKILWLEDIFNTIRESEKIENVIFFHPIFEAIHPFADGNGRIGRLLLTSIFKYLGITKNNWIFFSDIIEPNKQEYLHALHNVQTTNDWEAWTDYFLQILNKIVEKRKKQIIKMLNLFKVCQEHLNLNDKLMQNTKEGHVFAAFIKYPRLNKTKTIENLIKKHDVPQASAYRAFDNVASKIKAIKYSGDLYEFTALLEITRMQ